LGAFACCPKGAGPLDHCKPLFVQQGIMTVHNVYIYQCLLEIKKQEENLPLNCDVHHQNTRGHANVHRTRVRLDKLLKCFPVSGIKMYNRLPLRVRQKSARKFDIVIKKWLVLNPFYSLREFWDTEISGIANLV
jgi:hypothetical protein